MRRGLTDVSVIVVHYRGIEETLACAASLEAACDGLAFDAWVVDNSPSQELISSGLPGIGWANLLSLHHNAGLARATNLALSRSVARYHLCMNPDVVAKPKSIRDLVAFGDAQPQAGVVAARLENRDGTLQFSCRRFYTLEHVLARRTPLRLVLPARTINRDHLMEDYDHQTPAVVDWVLGSCMLVRGAAIAQVGPMDERFFLYFEDVDWCYRMHLAGWEVIYYPGASMVHHHKRESAGRGLSREKRAHVASFVAFHRKHGWHLLRLRPNRFRLLGPTGSLPASPAGDGTPH